jgi:hypothetical protein
VSVTPEGKNNLFRRNTYSLLAHRVPALTLVHYLGDETVAADFPHGNAKQSTVPHVRTCPSMLRMISKSDQVPSNVYKKVIAENDCVPALQPVSNPRNTKQVANIQANERKKFRLTHDALYNIHALAYDLDGFVAKITTYPDLVLICGSKNMAHELDQLLLCQSPSAPQLLSYDTTFQLGDFFVSPLLFRHTAFTSSPVIPLLFLVHDRKFQTVHEELMKYAASVVPSLSKTGISIPIVTDDESGICNAIDTYLPNLARLKCWNHTINSAKVNINTSSLILMHMKFFILIRVGFESTVPLLLRFQCM